MAVTSFMFGNFLKCALNKEVQLATGATGLKVMLLTSSASINQDTWIYKSSVTNEVASGNGYTTGGATLSNVTVTYTAGTNTIAINADDTVWSSSTITSRYAVIYDSSGASDSVRPLIGWVDFGADMSSSNGNFTITWDNTANAIFTISTT